MVNTHEDHTPTRHTADTSRNTMSAMNRRLFLVTCAAGLLPASARAHSYKHSGIAIGHAWALPVEYGDGQLFFPLVNSGKTTDELVAARSPICSVIELRRNNRYDDPPLTSFVLEPGKPLPMRPTARHLRLMGLREPLRLDQRFAVILDFLNAGETEIEVHVEHAPGD